MTDITCPDCGITGTYTGSFTHADCFWCPTCQHEFTTEVEDDEG